ncbi:mediator of RNA polymerase II transcription subunit 29-like [Haliaeetus albicilla]|uniref:mediator of RNA polymerase II transcription subunit 29-like n=1 Tax=Haliaeetus albicilla TaxID=8969 RepID=UPI0037E74AE4
MSGQGPGPAQLKESLQVGGACRRGRSPSGMGRGLPPRGDGGCRRGRFAACVGRGLPPRGGLPHAWGVVCRRGEAGHVAVGVLPPWWPLRRKSANGALHRFNKNLEEFYALCDLLELCLRLAHKCLLQSFNSAKHAPALVPAAPKGEGGAGKTLPYTQYLPLIKAQIAGAKDIHNALLEGANKITGKLSPPGGP